MRCGSGVKVGQGRNTCRAELLSSQAGKVDGDGVVQNWFHIWMVKGWGWRYIMPVW